MTDMGRKPGSRNKKAETSSAAQSLQAALQFCAVAYRDKGEPYQTHVVMHGGWLCAFDGILAAGHPIDDQTTACPQGTLLRQALARPGAVTFTAEPANITVKIDRFRARVPCIDINTIQYFAPDAAQWRCDDSLKDAIGAVAHLASAAGKHVIESALLLEENTVMATDRSVIMQSWHGQQLPGTMIIPKVFADAIWKSEKPITGFGRGENTATVYFSDNSWIRTQLYAVPYPTLEQVAPDMGTTGEGAIPAGLFEAVEGIAPFCDKERPLVHLVEGKVSTDPITVFSPAASIDVKDLPALGDGQVFSPKHLAAVAGRVTSADWTKNHRAVFFYGERLRCAVIRAHWVPAEPYADDVPNTMRRPDPEPEPEAPVDPTWVPTTPLPGSYGSTEPPPF